MCSLVSRVFIKKQKQKTKRKWTN